ncbi:hypothetical protein [Methylobacterium fujisawaense]|uniref:hypothetical protein n=1 Tax=Methylobacterium fujisawaense TaxID=107400 RepID=UPI00313D0D6F
MKRSEISAGGIYSNGKQGRHRAVRRVLDMGPQYKLYSSQEDTDCLSYAIVEGRREHLDHGTTPGGQQIKYSTTASFAAWAKERIGTVEEAA